jgi:ABC-type sugar transport system substrate-binding protein
MKGRNRRPLLVLATLALVVGMLPAVAWGVRAQAATPAAQLKAGCSFKLNDKTAAKVKSGAKLKFAFVAYALPSPFWAPVRAGLQDAAKKYGVDVQFMGPQGTSAQEQVNLINTVVRSGVDGVVAVSFDSKTLGPVIDQVMKAGVPVMTTNIDAPASCRIAFSGQDLVDSGRVGAQQFVLALNRKRPGWQNQKTKVALLGEAYALDYVRERIQGFKQVMSQYKGVKFVGPYDTTFDYTKAYGIIENFFKANPDIGGLYSAGIGHVPAAQYLTRNHLDKKVVNVGFNFFPGTEQGMKSGAIDASVGQFPYKQGYNPVKYLVDLLKTGRAPSCAPVCYVGAQVANQQNVKTFDFKHTK